jgi:septum site-determining protein MinC
MQGEASFDLKGGIYPMTVLRLIHGDLAALDRGLAQKVAQAPAMLQHAPVVIDLLNFAGDDRLDLAQVLTLLRHHGMVPVAIRNADAGIEAEAVALGIGLLRPERHKPAAVSEGDGQPPPGNNPAPSPRRPARILHGAVRSGQQIYARESDLVVIGSVNHGAEVVADGCIHIYGTLKGRAIAGAQGDGAARIYCQNFAADLTAIAGCYQVNDAMPPMLFGKAVEIHLRGDTLVFDPLAGAPP